ncbi:MAG TPA: NAD(P)-dependent oxidoreductase [Chloroflexota bacterium]|nr:NAD(P)-dependent oxidoreductase [Chloroflexota bacterium]
MILITGGMGFIGLHTARRFLDAGERVVITQYTTRREPDFIRDEIGKRVTVARVDVTSAHDMIDVVRRNKVTGIVHLAVPGLAALSAAEDYRVNMMGLINVLEAARVNDVPRVTFASSATVYGGLADGPFREDALLPVQSTNATETYKKAWEILALHYGARTGLEAVSARVGGIFGPLYHTLANAPSRICLAAARGKPADFSGSRTGAPYADDVGNFCYVKDCALGLFLIQTAKELPHRVYNISSGRRETFGDFVAAARQAAPDLEVELRPGPGPHTRPSGYLEITRAANEVGYAPQFTLEQSTADYIEWLRRNPL